MPKTKIIATLGPSTDNKTILKKMIFSGLDVVRLNFSHGTIEEHKKRVELIKEINKKYRRSIKIMQDLEGYRIRIGILKKEIELKKNQIIYLTQNQNTNINEIYFDYKGSLDGIKKGNLLFIDDGKIVLEVKNKEKKKLKLKVLIGGILKSRKGINIPDAELEFENFTKKDREDIQFAIEEHLDYIAQSFVNEAKDITMIKEILKKEKYSCKVFAKIESKKSLLNIDEIIKVSDGIIIARGDLGICVPIYKIPIIQKEIIKKAKILNKPTVVATQMLDSMTENQLPTRAEVSDVANAILDGANYLLLSSETAVGKYPDKTIKIMNEIIKQTEDYQKKLGSFLV